MARVQSPARRGAALVLGCIGTLAAACQKSGSGAPETHRSEGGGQRIVSLSPALTHTLSDLGLGDLIVGRSAFCREVPATVPVVGSLGEVDLERLALLRPTHVLVQPPSRGIDPALMELARREGFTVAEWRIETLGDIRRTVRELPAAVLAEDPAALSAASGRADELLAELDRQIGLHGPERWRGPVLLLASGDPVLVHGRDTYLDEILTALGATNAVSQRGWIELSLEDILRLDAPAIMVTREQCPDGMTAADAAGPVGRLDLAALRDDRIALLCHPDVNLPSTGLVGVIPRMREALEALNAP